MSHPSGARTAALSRENEEGEAPLIATGFRYFLDAVDKLLMDIQGESSEVNTVAYEASQATSPE